MKFCIKTFSLLIVLISFTTPTIRSEQNEKATSMITSVKNLGKESTKYFKMIDKFFGENEIRHANARNALNKLKRDFENSKIVYQEAEVVNAFNEASDLYRKMNRVMRETCWANKATYHEVVSLPELSENMTNFISDSNWVIRDKINFLSTTIGRTKLKMEAVRIYLDKVNDKVTNVSGILQTVKASLRLKMEAEKEDLDLEIIKDQDTVAECAHKIFWCWWFDHKLVEEAKKSKTVYEKILSRTVMFLDESENYVKWIEASGKDLRDFSDAQSGIMADVMGSIEGQESLVEIISDSISDRQLENNMTDAVGFSQELSEAMEEFQKICFTKPINRVKEEFSFGIP